MNDDIARRVASITESELGVESERTSYNILGEPGQSRRGGKAGKAFGCSV
jgi:hypothetical protein